MRALYMLGFLSISPYTKYVLRSHLARTLVRYVPSTSPNLPEANLDEEELHRQSTVKSLARHQTFRSQFLDSAEDPRRKILLKNLITNFSTDKKYKPESFFRRFMEKKKFPKRHKLFDRAHKKLSKQLDLVKFIAGTRGQLAALIGLLSPNQQLFTSEFS